jgi:uncharacterized OB-fold protein
MSVLPDGLPAPVPSPDGLDRPYWEGTRRHELWVQRCRACQAWQWGPEWICHACRSFDVGWGPVAPTGRVYSWERVWHPVHPVLADACPYTVVLVELPHAGGIRMVGNLVDNLDGPLVGPLAGNLVGNLAGEVDGHPAPPVTIGDQVTAVFEDHDTGAAPFTLVQWRRR